MKLKINDKVQVAASHPHHANAAKWKEAYREFLSGSVGVVTQLFGEEGLRMRDAELLMPCGRTCRIRAEFTQHVRVVDCYGQPVVQQSFEDMRFRVPTEELSAAVQDVLLKRGYNWWNHTIHDGAQHTDACYLYAGADGQLGYSHIKEFFNGHSYPEYTPIATVSIELRLVEKPKAYIVIDGVAYSKDDILQSIASGCISQKPWEM